MRELVHEQDGGMPGESGVQVELLPNDAAISDRQRRQMLEALGEPLGLDAAMRLEIADHDVGAGRLGGARRLQHGVGLADAGGGAEEDAQPAAGGAGLLGLDVGEKLVRVGPGFGRCAHGGDYFMPSRARFSSSTLTRGLAEHAQPGAPGMGGDEGAHRSQAQVPDAGDAVRLVVGRREADVGVEAAGGGGDQIDRDRGAVGRVGGLQGGDARLDRLGQRGVEGPRFEPPEARPL